MNLPSQVSEIEISYKPTFKKSELFKINSCFDAVNILRTCWADDIHHKERVYLVLLNRGNKVLGVSCLSVGGITGCIIDTKVLLQTCLVSNACAFVVSHNHPSGNLSPSKGDIDVTMKIKTAASYLDIEILDHIILTDEGYYSFAESGRL